MTIAKTTRQINFLRNQGVPLMRARRSVSKDQSGTRLESGEQLPPSVSLSGVTHPDGLRAQAAAIDRDDGHQSGALSVERLRVLSIFGKEGPSMSSYVYDIARQIVLQRPTTQVFVWTRAANRSKITSPIFASLPATIHAFSDTDIARMNQTRTEVPLFTEARIAAQNATGPRLLIIDSGLRSAPISRAVRALIDDSESPSTTTDSPLDIIASNFGGVVHDGTRYDVTINASGNEDLVRVSGSVSTTFPFPRAVLDHVDETPRRPTSTVVTTPRTPQSVTERVDGTVTEFAIGTWLRDPGAPVRVDLGSKGHIHVDARQANQALSVIDSLVTQAASKTLPWSPDRCWDVRILPVSATADEAWHQAKDRWANLDSVIDADSSEQVLGLMDRGYESSRQVSGFRSWTRTSVADLQAAHFTPTLLVVPDPTALDEDMATAVEKTLRQGRSCGVHVAVAVHSPIPVEQHRYALNCAFSAASSPGTPMEPMVLTSDDGRTEFIPFATTGTGE